jgi:hypothetical protein
VIKEYCSKNLLLRNNQINRSRGLKITALAWARCLLAIVGKTTDARAVFKYTKQKVHDLYHKELKKLGKIWIYCGNILYLVFIPEPNL